MPSRPSEDDLIARYFAPLAAPEGLGLRDDAALLKPRAGHDLVATADALVAGVHFFADDPPNAIARKALRVNLSDLAAKGAEPLGYLLTLALPDDWREAWLSDFAEGLRADAALYACHLFGGDTVKTPGPLTISITALGEVAAGQMVKRTGIGVGDHLYVTGAIGDAALGLQRRLGRGPALSPADEAYLRDRYLLPQPRLALIPAMRDFASAGMDVSDGFVGDLAKMLRASGVTASVDLARLPLSSAAKAACSASPEYFRIAATGGDDYELLCAVPPARCAAFEDAAARASVALAAVGEASAGHAPPQFIGPDGAQMNFERGAFSHF